MGLTAGSRLGVYEILSPLGAGGMGEVYRARDTKLGREVAVKVLPEAFAFEPDRVARFEREAKVLASLNHPHIAALHGMEKSDGQHFLIMELVEGETLADRLRRGALPVADALTIAIQMADALEAAHEKGVVHRDLKPANVKVTPDDKVKVLDFGLAKAMEREVAAVGDMTHSPTLSMMATQAGVILGTAAYMSPEQAKGLAADHRSDIFSFGSVLYEMLTGRQPFHGDSAPDILASVLARDADLTVLPPNLHPRLTELLRRCLEKIPKRRWQAVGDVRAELESIAAGPRGVAAQVAAVSPHRSLWQRAIPLFVTGVVTITLTGAAMWLVAPPPAAPVVARLTLTLPEGQQMTSIARGMMAISPDGTRVAYVTPAGVYVRSIADFNANLVAGGVGIGDLAFAPDGQSLAFYVDGLLKRVAVAGGTVVTICPTGPTFGVSWTPAGVVFSRGNQGVFRVSPNGGTPEQIVMLAEGEWAHGPQLLPDEGTVIFTLSTGTTPEEWDAAQIVAQPIGSADRTVLVRGGRDARYVPTGHLLYAQGGVIFAAPFDPQRLEVLGGAVPVIDGVRRSTNTGSQHFSVSATGSVIYMPGPAGTTASPVDIVLADRAGVVRRLAIPSGPYEYPRVSPDGSRLAFGTGGSDQNIWVHDLAGTTAPRRLTFGGKNRFPVWSADGRRVLFQSDREGDPGLFWQPADGTGTADRLTKAESDASHLPEAWSPTDDLFLYSVITDGTRTLWSLSVSDKKAQPFGGIASSAPIAPAFSPDGRWIVYASTRPTAALYVQPVPPTGATYQISMGGFHPVWSRDGREIAYVPGFGRIGVIDIVTQPAFKYGPPELIPRRFNEKLGPTIGRNFDLTPDGRFVGLATPGEIEGASTSQINVVLNWHEELKARVPIP